jgi:hypothetical protein
MNKLPLVVPKFSPNSEIQLSRIEVREDYLKQWNELSRDFVLITKDEKPLRETLYRVGGMGGSLKDGEKYFMLLKYVEAFYEDTITTDPKRKPHLKGIWCILDKQGNEKVEFKQFGSPYLTGGCVYSINSDYYNIETGELYGHAYHSFSSSEYIFLHTADGVVKINKKDGSKEVFK